MVTKTNKEIKVQLVEAHKAISLITFKIQMFNPIKFPNLVNKINRLISKNLKKENWIIP
jgi:hypothetical protein